jgi:hypothetical protein
VNLKWTTIFIPAIALPISFILLIPANLESIIGNVMYHPGLARVTFTGIVGFENEADFSSFIKGQQVSVPGILKRNVY